MDKLTVKIVPNVVLIMASVLVCMDLSNQSLVLLALAIFLWVFSYAITEDKIDKRCADLNDKLNAVRLSQLGSDAQLSSLETLVNDMNTSVEQFKHALGEVKRIDACIQELDKSGVEHAKEIATIKNAMQMKNLGR